MPTTLDPSVIALRLTLAVLTGVIIGFNRGEYGHAAGLRTILLVCVAAALAMLQADALRNEAFRSAPDSPLRFDIMRLPLGILSGMGFIGAGAIIRRGNFVQGLTTAATLWIVTVLGLCFGGGQIVLGLAGLVIAVITLWCLKWLETRLRPYRIGNLELTCDEGGPTDAEFARALQRAGMVPISWSLAVSPAEGRRVLRCDVRYRVVAKAAIEPTPAVFAELSQRPHVLALHWRG
jgi:putative Mg2+ transporter-C (MgtC) family protein